MNNYSNNLKHRGPTIQPKQAPTNTDKGKHRICSGMFWLDNTNQQRPKSPTNSIERPHEQKNKGKRSSGPSGALQVFLLSSCQLPRRNDETEQDQYAWQAENVCNSIDKTILCLLISHDNINPDSNCAWAAAKVFSTMMPTTTFLAHDVCNPL